jgi:hypothetical protein
MEKRFLQRPRTADDWPHYILATASMQKSSEGYRGTDQRKQNCGYAVVQAQICLNKL